MKRICSFISRYMALLVLVVAVLSYIIPTHFDWTPDATTKGIMASSISWLLGLVMFGMGLSLNPQEFKIVFTRPKDIICGSLAQFLIMPTLAWALTKVFDLPDAIALGVILVGACPGGTASNVMTYLAGGDLPLSVGMTGVSTLLAPVLTPAIVLLLAKKDVDVSFMSMFMSIVEVVIAPIAIGLIIRHFFRSLTEKLHDYLPAFSSIVIMIIVAIVICLNRKPLHDVGVIVILVVMLHNLCGFALGFAVGYVLRLTRPKRTAISIEVGMQNSGLACSLAHEHFAALQAATVPGAIFSVWHNIAGALMARLFVWYNEKHK